MRRLPCRLPTLLLLLLTLKLGLPVRARAQTIAEDAFRDLPPIGLPEDASDEPEMTFRLVTEIAIPGPLPGQGPRWFEGSVVVPAAGGMALARPRAGAEAAIVPQIALPAASPGTAWTADAKGRRRFAPFADDSIVAQRRCRGCREGWKKSWKLDVPGTTPAPPLVDDGRVFFGARDNRIYCVRARNGHRVWLADATGRVSQRLVLWNAPETAAPAADDAPAPPSLVLVVPDGGAEMLALSGKSGREVASLRVAPGEGKLVGTPLVTPDGNVVVARQKYAESEASLMVYRVEALGEGGPAPQPGDAAEVNGRSPEAAPR